MKYIISLLCLLSVSVNAQVVEVADTFSHDLAYHRTSTGNYLWTQQGGSMIASNACALDVDSVNSSYYNVNHTISTNNYTVQCDVAYPTTTELFVSGTIFGRFNTSNGDGYYVLWTPGIGIVGLRKMVSGAFTELGHVNLPGATNHTLKLVMSGTTISGYVDGNLITSTIDSSITAAGKAGIGNGIEGVDVGAGIGLMKYSNFKVTIP